MPPPPRRRPQELEEEEEEEDTQQIPDHVDEDGDEPMEDADADAGGEMNTMIKNLVRYALACEFSRTPIRRDAIRDKVLGPRGRSFKKVFAGAQKQLRATFGMEMVELPTKDRNLLTTEQKRKAAKSQSQKEPTSNAYILVSVLPEAYTTPNIIPPSKVQSADGEAAYIGLYTIIIAIITLSGGELSEPRLRRYLTRLNAAENMPSMNPHDATAPSEKTDAVLQRMVKQGYLVKVTESRSAGDDEGTTWHVGPRGKIEVDKEAIANVVRAVYGGSSGELEKKLETSLKIKGRSRGGEGAVEEEEVEEAPPDGDPGPSHHRRHGRR
ncbi:hypothetical protein VTJ83DRAFT_1640 [Remersonia thermophila]|uniref:MAGE domain-containing protein n=1 Tax=Remersonia thermophila TaxID=72144 RepID=A0ABR4DGR0_9PEZI